MSWHFEGHARTKGDAAAVVLEHHKKHAQHFPASVAEALISQINLLPDLCASELVHFRAVGHLSAEQRHGERVSHAYGRSELAVEIVQLLEPAPVGAPHD